MTEIAGDSSRAGQARQRLRPGGPVIWAALLCFMGLMFSGVWLSRFSRDESQWIYTARYLTLFRQGDFLSPEWDNYWTETQPPLARYVMGLSLRVGGGFDLMRLNGPWDFSKEDSENREMGNWPTDAMIFWARLPLGIVASAAVLFMYLVARKVGGPVAGICAAGWLAANPRSRELMTRAEADGLLIALMLAGLWMGIKLIYECEESRREGGKWLRPLVWTLAVGLAVGLAAAAKLTGAVGVIALGGAMFAYAIMRQLANRGTSDGQVGMLWRRFVAAGASVIGCGAVGLLVFVLLNPTLYDDPAAKSVALFQHRQAEMEEQMAAYPSAALGAGWPRIQTATVRSLFTYSVTAGLAEGLAGKEGAAIGEKIPLDAVLVLVGMFSAIACVAARMGWNRRGFMLLPEGQGRGLAGAAGIALVYTVVFFGAIALNMGLDWDRYVLPLSAFAALWAGVGLGYFWEGGLRRMTNDEWRMTAANSV